MPPPEVRGILPPQVSPSVSTENQAPVVQTQPHSEGRLRGGITVSSTEYTYLPPYPDDPPPYPEIPRSPESQNTPLVQGGVHQLVISSRGRAIVTSDLADIVRGRENELINHAKESCKWSCIAGATSGCASALVIPFVTGTVLVVKEAIAQPLVVGGILSGTGGVGIIGCATAAIVGATCAITHDNNLTPRVIPPENVA